MFQHHLRSLIAATAVLLLSATVTHAQTTAYADPLYAGNQLFNGNLGLDFTVNAGHPIAVSSVGAFDGTTLLIVGFPGDGFVQPVNVAIFTVPGGVLVPGTMVTLMGLTGTLAGGDRFLPLAAPVLLVPGNYSVVANYNPSRVAGPTDPNGNFFFVGFMASTENTGAGAITFTGVNSARFDANATLDLPPAGVFPGAPSNLFNAGTFQFAPILAPTLTKMFGAAVIDIGGITTLTFTLMNPAANAIPLTGLAFTDTLPGGLAVAAANGLPNGTCVGAITAAGNLIGLSGVTLAAGASCTFSVNVTGTVAGPAPNTTSTVASNEAPAGTAATATITVAPVITDAGGVYQLRYLANLDKADSYVNATNAGTLNGVDPDGRICANFYVFDPAEELVACCACLITPNGLVSLSARNDLTFKTLTGAALTSGITVKVLASLPSAAGTCNASSPTAANLVRGLKLWAITPHLDTNITAPNPPGTPVTPQYQLGETEFSKAELSTSELAKLSGFCRFIQVVASTFGQCRSCPFPGNGAQGADIK